MLVRGWGGAGRGADAVRSAVRLAGAVVTRTWLATYCRLRVHGRANLPAAGSFVIVANHASHLDALCLLAALPLGRLGRAFPAAAADYFFASPVAGALSGLFLNALPFARKGRVRQTLDACRELLAEDGNVLILFPEGTRSTSGETGEFKSGVGELVAGTGVPVVPCYLAGGHRAMPKGSWFPRPRKLELFIGRLMRFDDLERSRANASLIAMELESAVRQLAAGPVTEGSPSDERYIGIADVRSDHRPRRARRGARPRLATC